MRMSRTSILASLLCFAFSIVCSVRQGVAAVRDWVTGALDVFKPEPFALRFDEPALALTGAGQGLDLALQQSLRHEAGVPRYSAARNT